MNNQTQEHPSDEVLAAFALGEEDTSTQTHVAACQSCSRQVGEMRELSAALSALAEENVPSGLREKVMTAVQRKQRGSIEWFSLSIMKLLKSPFVLVLTTIFFIVSLYIFFVFVL